MSVYDPCAGSGGMLILSKEYVEEHGGDGRNLALAGQEKDGGVWAICKMNMLLHGIPDADIRNNDDGTLEDPAHIDRRRAAALRPRDRQPAVLAELRQRRHAVPRALPLRLTPEKGKKADLMFVQHMLASLRPGGMVATVMPHGVLFRGGDEGKIRTGFLKDDVIEAVIGLGPQLFYGTGIPACILVLRPAAPSQRRARARCCSSTPTANTARAAPRTTSSPSTSRRSSRPIDAFEDIPGFARVVARDELAENDDNLNIRRYVDNARRPSRTTCARICTAASRRPRSRPRRTCSPRTASTPTACCRQGRRLPAVRRRRSERRDLKPPDRVRRRCGRAERARCSTRSGCGGRTRRSASTSCSQPLIWWIFARSSSRRSGTRWRHAAARPFRDQRHRRLLVG